MHLFGALASHKSGLQVLESKKVFSKLIAQLNLFVADPSSDQILRIKAALFALGQLIGGLYVEPLSNDFFLGQKVVDGISIMLEYVEHCPILDVRGVAFWSLNMAGGSRLGALKLAECGFEGPRNQDESLRLASLSSNVLSAPRHSKRCFRKMKSHPTNERSLEAIPKRRSSSFPSTRTKSMKTEQRKLTTGERRERLRDYGKKFFIIF